MVGDGFEEFGELKHQVLHPNWSSATRNPDNQWLHYDELAVLSCNKKGSRFLGLGCKLGIQIFDSEDEFWCRFMTKSSKIAALTFHIEADHRIKKPNKEG